jgi:adenylate kinase
MDIIIFGMQGSGKGTQGKSLATKYGLQIFDTGSHFRENVERGTPLGKIIQEDIEKGILVDDEIVMDVVEQTLKEIPPTQPILFDGLPRTRPQAEHLLEHLTKHGRDAFAVYIKISEDEALKRITQRRICSSCQGIYPPSFKGEVCEHCGGKLITRADDNEESIRRRIETYKQETLPVINSFYDRDRLIEVDGEQPIENVTKEMLEKVAYLFS